VPAVRHTRATALVLCVAVVFATAGCKAGPRPPSPVQRVTIALLTAVTGASSALGSQASQGAQLAVDLVNGDVVDIPLPLAAGAGLPGLGGARMTLTVADSAGDAGRVTAALDKIDAAAVVAADAAPVVEAAARLADQRRLPTVDALTDAAYLTGLGLDWYFRTAPEERAIDGAALALLANRPGAGTLRRIAVLYPALPATPARTMQNLSDLATAAGFTVAGQFPVRAETGAAATSANDVEDAVPDALLAVAGTAAEAAAQLRVASRVRPVVPVVGLGAGFATASDPDETPEVLLRAAGWSADLTSRNPVARAVADLYKRRFNAPMTETAAATFTATMAVATAINGAGAVDPASVRAGLHQLWIPATQTIMPWDGIRFVASGQNELAGGVVEQRSGTAFRVVYPRELAAAAANWPSPKPSR